MNDAAGRGGVDFRAVFLHEVDAGVQGGAAEERIGPIAERRGDRGFAGQRRPHRQDRHQPAQAIGEREVALGMRERLVERGRVGVDRSGNERPADAALGRRSDERVGGKTGSRDDRGQTRRAAPRGRTDFAERGRLPSLHPIQRIGDQAEARGRAQGGIVGGRREVGESIAARGPPSGSC